MSTQHTPGPWHVEKQRAPNGGVFYDVTEENRQAHDRIAMVGPWTASRDGYEAESNARLIAAAPELLAMLRAYAADCICQHDSIRHPDGCGACEDARELIARAGGAPL